MRPEWRVRVLGGAMVVAAAVALVAVPEPLGGALAVALGVVGLFLIVVVAEPAIPAATTAALLQGSAEELDRLRDGLRLEGAPVYVHDQGNVGEERMLLLAAPKLERVPVLDRATLVYRGDAGTSPGVALAPPGLRLVQQHEADSEAPLRASPLPEVEAFLQGMLGGADLARSPRLTEENGKLVFRFRAGAVRPPCLDRPASPHCPRAGCAICQSVGCALARSLERPVVLREAEVAAPTVTLRFESPEELT